MTSADSPHCLFIGDLIERGEQQGSCVIEENLSISDIKCMENGFQIETDLCSKVDQTHLSKENAYVVVGIDFEFKTEDNDILHGSLSGDVLGGKKYTINLLKESCHLEGKFKINHYQLIPIELLSILHANVFKVKNDKNHACKLNSCDPQDLDRIDLFKKINPNLRDGNEIINNPDNLKVMTRDEKDALVLFQKTVLLGNKEAFSLHCSDYMQKLKSTNWIDKIYCLLTVIESLKPQWQKQDKFLDDVCTKHEERLKFVSDLRDCKIMYISEANEFNDFIVKDNCFVLFFNDESSKSDSKNYEDNLTFYKEFVESNQDSKVDPIFLAVDTKVISKEEMIIKEVPNSVVIYHISKSDVVSKDLMNENRLNVARSKTQGDGGELIKRGRFSMPCPKCLDGCCEWLCRNCGTYFDFGFNDALYCNCNPFSGTGTLLHNFEFRCRNLNHGFYFVNPLRHLDLDPNQHIFPLENITVLILGQTNVGKTTFIKAMISILAYADFEDTKRKVEDLDVHETDNCRMYSIRYKSYNIQFIDTPGFGKGLDDDAGNVEKIMAYMNNFDRLHAVCVLTKSYEWEAKILQFKFYVSQILSILHQNLKNNIVVCSTYFLSLSLEPIKTLPILKECIDSSYKLLPDENLFYFFDVEFYNYIKNQNVGVDEPTAEENKICRKSWDKTTKEGTRFLDFVISLEPRDVKETLKLNESRSTISTLTKSISQVMEDIERNMGTVQGVQKIMSGFIKLNENFGKRPENIFTDDKHPENICTNEYCLQYFEGSSSNSSNCECSKKCLFKRKDIVTEAIHCAWKTHVYVSCKDHEVTEVRVKSGNFDITVKSTGNSSSIGDVSRNLETTLEGLRGEKDRMIETSGILVKYLNKNAVIAQNDFYSSYLDYLILEEEKKSQPDSFVLNHLQKLQGSNREEMKLFKQGMADNYSIIVQNSDESDVDKLIENLYSLPIYGEEIASKLRKKISGRSVTFVEKRSVKPKLNKEVSKSAIAFPSYCSSYLPWTSRKKNIIKKRSPSLDFLNHSGSRN